MKILIAILVQLASCTIFAADLPLHAVADKHGKLFYTGKLPRPKGITEIPVSREYLVKDAVYPKTLNRDRSKLSKVIDQGQCGSCVYHAVTSTWQDTMILRGMPVLDTSPQYLMDCAERRWMCGGSFFEYVAAGLVAKGGSALRSEYPYRASNQSCKGSPALHGKVLSMRLIDPSQKSIIAALNDNRTVAATIGAGGSFMNPVGGVVQGCSNIATNHQVEPIDYDCEAAVDAQGKCAFNAQGNLPNGVGSWIVRNSWGQWGGDGGFFKIKMTSSAGKKCFNITEEVGIIDVGDPLPPPGPQVFSMESPAMVLKVTLPADSKKSVDQAKAIIQPFLNNLK